jgi:hypothetical protein
MGHPPRVMTYPVRDFAELGERSGSRQGAGGLHNHAHFARAVQIADESLDGGGVAFLRAVTEPGDLADGECDVGASVGGKVKQHSNNGAVAPRFFHGRTVGIDSESGLRGRRPVVVAVGHSGCLFDFLDESFWVRVRVPFAEFLVKLMPRKSVKVPSRVKLNLLDSRLEKSFLRSFSLL